MMPDVFHHPSAKPEDKQAGMTYYRAFVGPGSVFDPDLKHFLKPPGAQISDIVDGTGGTLLLVEAGDPIEWTRPTDLPFGPNQPMPKLGGLMSKGCYVVLADGSVRLLRNDAKESTLRNLIIRNDGNAIDWNDLE
jgi:hypothetical protein